LWIISVIDAPYIEKDTQKMKPQARIQATIEILENIKNNTRIPMDGVVGDYMRGRRYIGSKDRSNIAERVYTSMRAHARLGWWLTKNNVEDTPRARIIAYVALIEEGNEKRFKDLFDGSQYSPAPLSDEELTFAKKVIGQSLEHKDMPPSVLVECPALYEEKLKAYFGDSFEDEMRAMIDGATLDIRINSFLTDRQGAKEALAKDGVETTETSYSPVGLRAVGKAYLAKTKIFHKGWISIQDEGSQMIAHICDAKPGMQVLDYCAGVGGKTLALASAMMRKGRVVAMDNDERRLAKGKERYKKAYLADIIETRALSDDKQRKWLKRQKNKFDIVLTDVPCTGTGTWRRNPDMRWSIYGPSLEELIPVQAEILERACLAVKPGGKLVYATCSLLPEENEQQIENFLKMHDEFELAPLDTALKLGSPYMRLTPHRHKTDGFFAAIMVKKETPAGSD
jgi:16S rRNA (cytosine967-C5)-methyltransferase